MGKYKVDKAFAKYDLGPKKTPQQLAAERAEGLLNAVDTAVALTKEPGADGEVDARVRAEAAAVAAASRCACRALEWGWRVVGCVGGVRAG